MLGLSPAIVPCSPYAGGMAGMHTLSLGRPVLLRSMFGAGHFAKSLAWNFTDLLLAYYVHVRVGLGAQDTGLLLFCSMTLGAALDVGVAFLLRHAEGSARRILTIQFAAGLATAGTLLVVFFSPALARAYPVTYLAAALGLFRLVYAVYDVAQNALVSLLPDDEEDAQRYVIWRQALSALARIAVAAIAFLLLGPADTGGEMVAAGGIALLIALTSACMFGFATSAESACPGPPAPWLAVPPGLPRLLLAGAALAGPLSLAARMVTFVGGGSPGNRDGAALLFAFVLGTLAGPLVLPRLPRDHQGRATIAYTMLTVLAAAWFLADTRSGLGALAACFVHGVGLGALLTLFWGAMSAAIRDHARRSGVRTDLTAFALLTASIKLSGGVFGVVLGLLLDGFKAGNPATMAVLAAITAAGGLAFLLASAPCPRSGAPSPA